MTNKATVYSNDELAEQFRAQKVRHAGFTKTWIENNDERFKLKMKEWYDTNRDSVREKQRLYYIKRKNAKLMKNQEENTKLGII